MSVSHYVDGIRSAIQNWMHGSHNWDDDIKEMEETLHSLQDVVHTFKEHIESVREDTGATCKGCGLPPKQHDMDRFRLNARDNGRKQRSTAKKQSLQTIPEDDIGTPFFEPLLRMPISSSSSSRDVAQAVGFSGRGSCMMICLRCGGSSTSR